MPVRLPAKVARLPAPWDLARGKQGENVHYGRDELLLVQIETLPNL
jgi:hypothetical protein